MSVKSKCKNKLKEILSTVESTQEIFLEMAEMFNEYVGSKDINEVEWKYNLSMEWLILLKKYINNNN